MTMPIHFETPSRCLLALIPVLALASCSGLDIDIPQNPGSQPVATSGGGAGGSSIEQASGDLTIEWDDGERETGTVTVSLNRNTNLATMQFPGCTLTGYDSEPPVTLKGSDGSTQYVLTINGNDGDVYYGKVQEIGSDYVRSGSWTTR